ncbi:(2Fe-2S) ferredoxin domain-containing protein [Sphingomonas adhaesiva]|uniref:(2Fe-2S) ferredoxin domain-containing protein n=1 Tax=Sphingomonas adhaesiva TaxID=28212 RepID=UPI002FF6E223
MKDHVASRWQGAVLVCGKCTKKIGGGFGLKGKTSLVKALRAEPGFGKGRKAEVGVVETRCLGVCPKRAVVLVDTRRPMRWRVVEEGADVARLAKELHDVKPASLPG